MENITLLGNRPISLLFLFLSMWRVFYAYRLFDWYLWFRSLGTRWPDKQGCALVVSSRRRRRRRRRENSPFCETENGLQFGNGAQPCSAPLYPSPHPGINSWVVPAPSTLYIPLKDLRGERERCDWRWAKIAAPVVENLVPLSSEK